MDSKRSIIFYTLWYISTILSMFLGKFLYETGFILVFAVLLLMFIGIMFIIKGYSPKNVMPEIKLNNPNKDSYLYPKETEAKETNIVTQMSENSENSKLNDLINEDIKKEPEQLSLLQKFNAVVENAMGEPVPEEIKKLREEEEAEEDFIEIEPKKMPEPKLEIQKIQNVMPGDKIATCKKCLKQVVMVNPVRGRTQNAKNKLWKYDGTCPHCNRHLRTFLKE